MADQTAGKIKGPRLILFVAIIVVLMLLLFSLLNTCSSGAGGVTSSVSNGPVTLEQLYGLDGDDVCDLLEDHKYTYDSEGGYWVREKGDTIYQFVAMDARGTYVNAQSLRETENPTDVFQFGLYAASPTDIAYGLADQGVIVLNETSRTAANESVEIAVVKAVGQQHLVTANRYTMDGYEYEIYSVSENCVRDYGVYGLSSRTIDRAYAEVVANYS